MKYSCKRKCWWDGRLWEVGDTVELKPQDADQPSVKEHFAEVKVAAPAAPEAPANVPDAPPAAADEESDGKTDDGEGTNIRENLRHLCVTNGVEVKPRMSMKAMREALAAKGIVVQ